MDLAARVDLVALACAFVSLPYFLSISETAEGDPSTSRVSRNRHQA
jgi:hypothetical protein